jgi:O-6-methylguanine DNA methyltransferase
MKKTTPLSPLSFNNGGDFKERVLRVVAAIPRGSVLSYGEVARRAGCPRSARAVGRILNGNYNSNIPCHRVVKANGDLGGYNRGRARKLQLLRKENAWPILIKNQSI